MSRLPLLKGVLGYIKQNNELFCMPGHKGGKGFLENYFGREFLDNLIKIDMTEVEGLDNLHNPEGIIKESGNLLSRLYGSKKSYFLVNGSTSGNLVMIFSTFNEGDKIIVERNCHKSIFSGIIMRKLKPVYVKNKLNNDYNAPLSIDMEHFLKVIKENKDAKGVIITYPNYYGICSNLKTIINECKKYKVKILVDSAHGAHFGINNKLPESAVKLGADMVVTSAHKTLPSLTQTAYLHVNNGDLDKVNFYLSSFLSTSPSYILLCSMDYARFYLETYGHEQYNKLIELANYYRNKINKNIDYLHIIGKEDINKNKIDAWDIDLTRYVINLKNKYNVCLLAKYLIKNNIQVEMNDESNLVLICTPFHKENSFLKLYNVLCNIDKNSIVGKSLKIDDFNIPKQKILPYEAMNKSKLWVNLDESKGKICAENIIPYPPGIPILMMGEIISSKEIKRIKYFIKNNKDIIGIKNGKILILK